MAQVNMSQDEVDSLLKALEAGEIDENPDVLRGSGLDPKECKYKFNAIHAAKVRYEYALKNGTFEEAEEGRKNLHRAAFSNWLFKHKITKHEYYQLLNAEAVKRGLQPPFI